MKGVRGWMLTVGAPQMGKVEIEEMGEIKNYRVELE
jgi:hypothetical protein